MTLKRRVREWLGIHDLMCEQARINAEQALLMSRFTQVHAIVRASMAGLGRVIAKLDPNVGLSEHDPARKSASDALGDQVIERLIAEDKARRHTLGEL